MPSIPLKNIQHCYIQALKHSEGTDKNWKVTHTNKNNISTFQLAHYGTLILEIVNSQVTYVQSYSLSDTNGINSLLALTGISKYLRAGKLIDCPSTNN